LLAEVSHAAWCAAPLEVNDGTPLGVTVQEAFITAVLIGPTTKIKTNNHPHINLEHTVLLPSNAELQFEA
jgi:hypothetical protein